MNLTKKWFAAIVTIVLCLSLSLLAFALPEPVTVSDAANEGFLSGDVTYSLLQDGVEIDIGVKASASNVRYAEINGVQTEIVDSNNKYFVAVGEDNVLVEITEKSSKDSAYVVKTQYFYIDASAKSVQILNLDSFMKTYDEKSIRIQNPVGIRFKSYASKSAKANSGVFTVEEYGYIVARSDKLGSSDLTLDFDNYVQGVGYNREQDIDVVFDSSDDEYDVFTGVLNNIPLDKYETELTCKTYTKIRIGEDVFTVYGEPVCGNVYETALESFCDDYTQNAVAKMFFDYNEYADVVSDDFTGTLIQANLKDGIFNVRGKLQSSTQVGKRYNVYLVTYDNYGNVVRVDKSSDFTVKEGSNTFTCKIDENHPGFQTKLYLLTEDMELICSEDKTLYFDIEWNPADREFYNDIADPRYGYGTDFEDCFEDEGVSVIDGITAVANLHAKYNNKEIVSKDDSEYFYSIEMDDASIFVDLSDRNSVNLNGINLGHATGGIDEENGYLYGSTETTSNDPQVSINGLNLDARNYNKIVLRMKYENMPGYYTNLSRQTLQVFFKTNTDSGLNETKSIRYELKNVSNVKDWFEVELDMSSFDDWKDVITGIRIDPLNNKAKFYIDYVRFVKSENSDDSEWYSDYLNYAYDNNLVKLGTFNTGDFSDNLTRKEFFDMLFKAYPESFFTPINSVTGIPDVDKNEKNSEIYLMLYNAGITLGFDAMGNLGLGEEISKSEVAAIINRLLVKKNRLIGEVDSNWDEQGSEYDFEFNSDSDSGLFKYTRAEILSNAGGYLSLKAEYDAYMVYNNAVSIDAEKYTKLRIRVKAEYDTPPTNNILEFFFVPQGVSGFSTTYCISTTASDFYLDEFGWYIFEVDLRLNPKWKGNITALRYDLINDAGTYTYDYIRFIENPYYGMPDDHEGLVDAGFTATKLMPEGFENGFVVSRVDQTVKWPAIHGLFNDYCSEINPSYNPEVNKPLWTIGPWWQGTGEGFTEMDLFENRDTTKGIYTLADTYGVNTITYNPVEKSITQRLNATKIYNGKPHDIDTYQWWPHQLLDTNANFTSTVDKEVNSADADRMFVELDIRMTDFKNTTNPEGRNVCSYLAYFYFRPKSNPTHKIWFGLNLFSTSASTDNPIGLSASTSVAPNWSPDSAAHQYMYGMPMAVVYNGIENSFNPSKGVVDLSGEWKHIRLDITPHIERAVEWANRDNIFGMEVTKEDMYFDGVNIGYEIHGNYDCTFEIKNFNMISYNLD